MSIRTLIHNARHDLGYRAGALKTAWEVRRRRSRQRKRLAGWHAELRANPPQVLLGANIGRSTGVRYHLEGIRKHSRHRIALDPPDDLLAHLNYHDLHTTFRAEVMSFDAPGIPVLHSNVYPYFIRWCRSHRNGDRLWVHTYHAPYVAGVDGPTLLPWQKEINEVGTSEGRHADVRISVSRWQQQLLLQDHGISTRYIPNGVDVSVCDAGSAQRFEASHGVSDFVLYVGRDEPVKNPDDFFQLAERLPERRFVCIGEGLTPSLTSASTRIGSAANLKLLGQLDRLSVQDAIAACSALVVTSKREGLPTLVLEGLAHGKPVVVPDDPGCVEAVDAGRHGLVYRASDIDDLVARTRDALLAGPQPEARQRILDEYEWSVVARELDDIYATAGQAA